LAVSVAAWDRGTVATPEATTPMSPGRAPRPGGTGRPRPLPGGRGRFVPVLPGLDDLPALREPTGEDELFVLEHRGHPAATVLGLAFRLWSPPPVSDGEPATTAADLPEAPAACQRLPAVCTGTIALQLRRDWLGDLVRTDAACAARRCGKQVDVAFSIGDYLDHHRPRAFRGVTYEPGGTGWLVLSGTEVRFRIPTIGDLVAALATADPEETLAQRCVRPDQVPAALAHRIDRALAALAPSLASDVTGSCPECGQQVSLRFDPVSYALAELRDAAAGVYEQVWLLASAFGWRETEILRLPRRRRAIYTELAERDRRGG
jgi:hypothetical protein